MKQSIIFILLFLFCSLNVHAQQTSLEGMFFDKKNELVSYASVALMDKGGKQLMTSTVNDWWRAVYFSWT